MEILSNKWALRWIEIARCVAAWSKDESTKVGSIAVDQGGRIVATGFNGMCRGVDDNREERHERPEKYFHFEHAERNLIYNAARVGTPLDGCVLVVTPLFPCMDCARGIVQSGFKTVIAEATDNPRWVEHNAKALELFNEVGIEVIYV
jgi:dCMP deaminase